MGLALEKKCQVLESKPKSSAYIAFKNLRTESKIKLQVTDFHIIHRYRYIYLNHYHVNHRLNFQQMQKCQHI